MLVSIGNLMKHWKFQKDWLTCHQVMTMESFQKSSCRIVDTCLLFSRREYVDFKEKVRFVAIGDGIAPLGETVAFIEDIWCP